jgi:hypothetical protein
MTECTIFSSLNPQRPLFLERRQTAVSPVAAGSISGSGCLERKGVEWFGYSGEIKGAEMEG